ncbi:MAG: hypothetical protein AB7K68_10265 [Bacteriovoracia bacterium]
MKFLIFPAAYFSLFAGLVLWIIFSRLKARRPARRAKVRILREVPGVSRNPAPVARESVAFECTLLRVQHEERLPEGAALLKGVMLRYGGELACQNEAGVNFYFRDEGDGHSALLAVSAARDLGALLSGGKTAPRFSLAHGFARFVQEEGKENQLLGGTFLEVNRLAPAAGQILLTERVARFAAPTVKCKTKNSLIAYSHHTSLGEVLARCERGLFGELDAYHSDDQLREVLHALGEDPSDEHFVGVAGQLRRFSYKNCSPEVAAAFQALFRKELERNVSYRLSSLVALASQFFTKETIGRELYADFVEALHNPDRRVKSNVVELFIHLYPSEEIAELRPYAKSGDHRISANLLIKKALERFDEKVIRALYGRVRGGSVIHVASALFALGEIAKYYRAQDPAFLRSKLSFLRLFEEIPYWVQHPNGMVRRQAVHAAKKLADANLDEKLRKIFTGSEDAELLALFESVYGWKKIASSAGRSA